MNTKDEWNVELKGEDAYITNFQAYKAYIRASVIREVEEKVKDKIIIGNTYSDDYYKALNEILSELNKLK